MPEEGQVGTYTQVTAYATMNNSYYIYKSIKTNISKAK